MFRDYTTSLPSVKETYRFNRIYQTSTFVQSMLHKYCTSLSLPMTLEEVFYDLDSFVDLSDPDMMLPNSFHALQTAEAIRKDQCPDWMQLVGWIHDFGKILYRKGHSEDGTDRNTQWALVGDTFVTGYPLPTSLVFPEWNDLHFEPHPPLYSAHCGLRNTLVSFGHDEYLYRVLSNHPTCTLPTEAMYMIRFHSLYAWHTHNEYGELEDDLDREMKPWVQRFNQYDLYTKSDLHITYEDVRDHYHSIARSYGLDGCLLW